MMRHAWLHFLAAAAAAPCADWLLCGGGNATTIVTPWESGALSGITLSNGLVSRAFVTLASGTAVFATFDFTTLLDDPPPGSGQSLLRSLAPEATVVLRGQEALTVGGVDRPGRTGPANFTLIANNSAAGCTFVGQGPTDSLAACQAACWVLRSGNVCNAVNWIPAPESGRDCVMKSCVDPAAPPLSPMPGCTVYTTLAPAGLPSLLHGAFLNRSGLTAPLALVPLPGALVPVGVATSPPQARFLWQAGRRGSPPGTPWPPRGQRLTASFTGAPGSALAGIDVQIVYEMYDGVPAVAKWVTVGAGTAAGPLPLLDGIEIERLGLAPDFAPLAPLPYADQYTDSASPPLFPAAGRLHVMADYQYSTFVNYTNEADATGTPGSEQPVLAVGEMQPLNEPLVTGRPPWVSARAYLLLLDDGPEQGAPLPRYPSSETYWGCTLGPCTPGMGAAMKGGITDRRGAAMRRLIATIAPQGLESPLQNHIGASDSGSIRAACDAMAAAGYEMLVLSYGSGFDAESADPAYRARIAADVAYCGGLGIEVGGYDLIGWTRAPGHGWDALTADGSDSGDACFASGWEAFLSDAFLSFAVATNMTMYETDGPYAGYGCSNSSHAGHSGQGDSVVRQSRKMAAMYSALQSAGIYVNAPDTYFAFGTSKQGIGYNEGTVGLPLDEGLLIQRQVIYDATSYAVPSMAWSQLPPSTAYDLGDPTGAARLELAVASMTLAGISAAVPNLPAAADPASAVYARWATVFKAHRTLLATGDTVHVRRPDGQGLDVAVRARAGLAVPGAVVVTNPTADALAAPALTVPLYFTGLAPGATVTVAWAGTGGGGPARNETYVLDARARVQLRAVSVPPRSVAWATVSLTAATASG